MSVTSDEHTIRIGGSTVTVAGTSGFIDPTWTLAVDGEQVDVHKGAGDFTLAGRVADGSSLEAVVHQALSGPNEVSIVCAYALVSRFTGFVA